MNKILILIFFIIFITGCSLNKNSKFWTSSENIVQENNENYKKIFVEEKVLEKEFNSSLKINLKKISNNLYQRKYHNNDGMLNYDGKLKKSSRYKFSKIKNFYQFEPIISFSKNNLIFFDNKGSILKFNENSKLIWKKNYYTKSEKRLKPILQIANDQKNIIVADNIAKIFRLDINNGNLIWSQNNLAPFNSQIKIYKDKFFIIDFTNTLRCFSIENGEELWNIKTENSLIRSQKKLSMVIVDQNLYFNNSIGDISAVSIDKGELLWQLPTQSSLIYESSFSLEASDIVTDTKNIFFSNNRNEIFSIDVKTGSFNWKNKVNSNLRATLVGDLLITVSLKGYLVIINKNSGEIIRITDIFKNFKIKKRENIKPTGFIVGSKNIYLSTSNGRLLVIDNFTGKTNSVLKIDNAKISRPFILNQNLYVVKDNGIIKLD